MAKKTTKVVFTVEAEITKEERVYGDQIKDGDLVGEIMKVKSGLYENLIVGSITAVNIS